MDRSGIAVAGTIIVDTINNISRYPDAGELTQITSVSKAIGGCVPNVATDLRRIDPDMKVWAIGCVGADEDGEMVKRMLLSCGADISLVKTVLEKTDYTQVMSVASGQRTFFTYSGASAMFGAGDIDFRQMNARLLHLGYFLLLKKLDAGDGVEILKKAKAAGLMTSIDLVSENSDRYKTVLPCLSYTDYLIVNELEASRMTGMEISERSFPTIAMRLLELGVREKVIVHFARGSVCASRGGNVTRLGSYILPEGYIKGTTGAGDAFCAGALYGIYKGLTDRDILEYGTVCAAMSLREQDAVSGLLDISTARELCRRYERRKL